MVCWNLEIVNGSASQLLFYHQSGFIGSIVLKSVRCLYDGSSQLESVPAGLRVCHRERFGNHGHLVYWHWKKVDNNCLPSNREPPQNWRSREGSGIFENTARVETGTDPSAGRPCGELGVWLWSSWRHRLPAARWRPTSLGRAGSPLSSTTLYTKVNWLLSCLQLRLDS